MASPRFIGIRDVVDPYRGLQDSVSKGRGHLSSI